MHRSHQYAQTLTTAIIAVLDEIEKEYVAEIQALQTALQAANETIRALHAAEETPAPVEPQVPVVKVGQFVHYVRADDSLGYGVVIGICPEGIDGALSGSCLPGSTENPPVLIHEYKRTAEGFLPLASYTNIHLQYVRARPELMTEIRSPADNLPEVAEAMQVIAPAFSMKPAVIEEFVPGPNPVSE